MTFPVNFEEKTGFNSIRDLLKTHCLGELGKELAGEISFSSDHGEVLTMLRQTEEFRQIVQFAENFPSQDYYDMTGHLRQIKVEGTYLVEEQLAELRLSYYSILSILSFFRTAGAEVYPELFKLASGIVAEKQILTRIDEIIDRKARVRDSASPQLSKIRKEKIARQSVVEKKIAAHLRAAIASGWTAEDAGITVKNGRLVIPLSAKFKRQLPGYIHDESATGQTVYMEPADVLEMNNEIRELENAEYREIIRILTAFADFLRPFLPDLTEAYRFLGTIDLIRAKAVFAISVNAGLPIRIHDTPRIDWNEAVHPLLFLSHSRQKKTVVPLTIRLTPEERIIVISGPNAGGKSVCLKTVGLVQYMLQCGLLPPAREDSEFGIFHRLFIDIGDEQSLENDLSTYTSKLLNLKFFLENLDDRSIFLIDEFGTGTDPSLGGAIAEAALESMNDRRAFGVVTTHYSNLKLLAGRVPGIINAAMLYDARKMKPLYQLSTGKPGSSFAFEIAQNIGFPPAVLKNAETKTIRGQLDFDRELQTLENEKTDLSARSSEIRVADEFLHEMIAKYQKQTGELEESKKEILRKAKEEAAELIRQSNILIEKTIREIRESQADKEKTKLARKEMNAWKEKLEPLVDKAKKKAIEEVAPPPLKKLEPAIPKRFQSIFDDLNKKMAQYELTLDLRGKRVDEAYGLLQRYIDDAILLNIPEVRILHGKGNGTLRQITREYLASVKEIRKYADEHIERGGSGITVVRFS